MLSDIGLLGLGAAVIAVLVASSTQGILYVLVSISLVAFAYRFHTLFRFAWHCFLAPIAKQDGSRKARLDGFYGGQADSILFLPCKD